MDPLLRAFRIFRGKGILFIIMYRKFLKKLLDIRAIKMKPQKFCRYICPVTVRFMTVQKTNLIFFHNGCCILIRKKNPSMTYKNQKIISIIIVSVTSVTSVTHKFSNRCKIKKNISGHLRRCKIICFGARKAPLLIVDHIRFLLIECT